jgi:hypothetical protein
MRMDVVAKRTSLAIDSDSKMSWFQNHPGGPGAAAPDSERDPIFEADELALSKIRSMCAIAMTSAEGVAQPIHTDMRGCIGFASRAQNGCH